MRKYYWYFGLLLIAVLVSCGGGGGGGTIIPTGTATLTWSKVTTYEDTSPIGTALAGYKVHYGTSSGVYTNTILVSSPTATNYTVTLPAGATYYFVVTAYNNAGIESAPSSPEVHKTL
jgi:fibronectin type 3 domain-containing protein